MGFVQWHIMFVEPGIALSVLLLGIAIVIGKGKIVAWLVPLMSIGFGIFHGYAHGLEMPEALSPAFYSFGFVTATASIHVVGVIIGHVLTGERIGVNWIRATGAIVAGAGLMILMGI